MPGRSGTAAHGSNVSCRRGTATFDRPRNARAMPRPRCGARRNRHQPSCSPSEHNQELLPRRTAARGRLTIRWREGPSHKAFEQRQISKRIRLAALARSSAAANIRSISRSSRIRGNGRSRRGRGSAADWSSRRSPSSTRNPKKRLRRLNGGRRSMVQLRPLCPEPRHVVGRCGGKIASKTFARPHQVAPIGCECVGRSATLRRHHVEKAIASSPDRQHSRPRKRLGSDHPGVKILSGPGQAAIAWNM